MVQTTCGLFSANISHRPHREIFVFRKVLRKKIVVESFYRIRDFVIRHQPNWIKITMRKSRATLLWTVVALMIFGITGNTLASIDDTDRTVLMSNFPYARGGDNDVELARIFLIPQRMYHPKRNSELINSLLGLPKNMYNAGRK